MYRRKMSNFDLEEYTVKLQKVTSIIFVDTEEDISDPFNTKYKPTDCMIFGMDDVLFGYKDFTAEIYYSRKSFLCLMLTRCNRIVPACYGRKPEMTFTKYCNNLPPTMCETMPQFVACLRRENGEHVFGDVCDEFHFREKDHLITRNSGFTPELRDFQRRFEGLLRWWNDTCTTKADVSDPNWIMYYLYECDLHNRKPIGFLTVFLNSYDTHKYKAEINHFFILPPYQRKGYGKLFLTHAYMIIQVIDGVTDIVIKHTTPDFNRMRDIVDTTFLLPLRSLHHDELPLVFTEDLEKEMKRLHLIEQFQLKRVYDIIRLYRALREEDGKYEKFVEYLNNEYVFITRYEKKDWNPIGLPREAYMACDVEKYILRLWTVGFKLKRMFEKYCPDKYFL